MRTKIIDNYLYNLSYQILIVIAPLITAPYVSRVLQPDGVGIYSYTTTIATAFSLFAALGLTPYGQREIAYKQGDKKEQSVVFWELFLSRLFSTIIIGIIYLVFCIAYFQYNEYLLLQSFIVFATMLDISWFFQGIEEFRIIAIRNVIIKIVTVLLIFLLVKSKADLSKYILINSASIFGSYLLFFLNLNKYLLKVDFKKLKPLRHTKGIIEFFIPLLATQLYSQLDKIMLGAIASSSVENGYYEQSRKIVSILIMVITSINTVMFPRISNLYAQDKKEEIICLYKRTYKLILMMVIPISIGVFFSSNNFVAWFFGEEYLPVAFLMKLSVILLFFMAIGNFVGMLYLSPTGKQNQMTAIYLSSAAINVVLNFFIIPRFQSVGAIMTSIVAEVFSGCVQLFLLQKSEYRCDLFDGVWKYILAGLIMAIGLYFLQRISSLTGIIQTVLEVSVAAIIYAIILLLEKEEILMIFFDDLKRKFGR